MSQERDQRLWSLAEDIWDYSELKFQETRSAAAQIEILRENGFEIEENLAQIPTAFSAAFSTGEGPVLAYLGEFDALSGLSQVEDLPYRKERSKGGCGHGCGHHLLGAAALGAAIGIKEILREKNICATVIYFGCPGEEGGSGKAFMTKYGVFDKVDVALTWHPFNVNAVMVGSMLANRQVYVRYRGMSSHAAASPQLGRSALDALELCNIGVNFLREHMESYERIHYALLDGGGPSPNVVQPYAEGLYLIRSKDTQSVNRLYDRFLNVVKGAALMTGTEGEVVFDKACSNVVPNSVLEKVLYAAFQEEGPCQYSKEEKMYAEQFRKEYPEANLQSEPLLCSLEDSKEELEYLRSHLLYERIARYQPSSKITMGSSDVGDVSNVVPTAQIAVCCFAIGTVGHSWQEVAQGKSSIAKKGMLKARDVLVRAGIKILTDPQIISAAKEELKLRLGKEGFVSPIPDGAVPQRP